VKTAEPGSRSRADGALNFNDDLGQMAAARHYLDWQYSMLRPHLGPSILEIGCGIGNFTVRLADGAARVVAIEPDKACLLRSRARVGQRPGVKLLHGRAQDLDDLLDAGERFDTVLCLNVLEHIDDDARALRDFAARLREGGRLVVQAPAGPWAFGEIDRALGHRRRYSRRRLGGMIREAGLALCETRYFNMVGILGWWWNAKVTRIRRQSDAQITVFDRLIVPVMSRVEGLLSPPFGQSLFAVGEKRVETEGLKALKTAVPRGSGSREEQVFHGP